MRNGFEESSETTEVSSRGLRHSGVPLGGLGTGSVEFRADGYFHEWQIMNNMPWGAGPEFQGKPDTAFFAAQVRGEGLQRTLLLAKAPPCNDYLNDPYEAPFIEHASEICADVDFPFTRLRFDYERPSPVRIELEAFSPFIPLDSHHSALPVAMFTVAMHNVSSIPLELTVMQVASKRGLVCPSLLGRGPRRRRPRPLRPSMRLAPLSEPRAWLPL